MPMMTLLYEPVNLVSNSVSVLMRSIFELDVKKTKDGYVAKYKLKYTSWSRGYAYSSEFTEEEVEHDMYAKVLPRVAAVNGYGLYEDITHKLRR